MRIPERKNLMRQDKNSSDQLLKVASQSPIFEKSAQEASRPTWW